MFNWYPSLLLLFLALPAVAQRAVMEGVNASRYTIKVDTTNGRVDIATTSYTGGIANVGLFVASNVVVGNLTDKNAVVLYSTGSANVLRGVTTSTVNVGNFIEYTAVTDPGSPAAGKMRLHAKAKQGFTRLDQDNEAPTNLVIGRDIVFIAKNTSGGTISKGQAVYVNGETGAAPNVTLAKADSLATLPADGMALDSISNNAFGQVMKLGIIESIDTSAFSVGDRVYVSTSVAGGLVNTRPPSPYYAQRMATVLASGVGNGAYGVVTAPFIGGEESGTISAFLGASSVTASAFFGDGSHLTGVIASANPPTYQYLTSGTGATYTTPANTTKIVVECVGGGGGGAASETNAGTAGNTTTFNSVNANGGSAGLASGVAGAGGSGGSGTADYRISGGAGTTPNSIFINANGLAGPANSGKGGGGGGYWSGSRSGGAGGNGEFFFLTISSPGASYTYTIGASAAGGSATQNGGAGGSGFCRVTEYH